jgi:hypothetical protein
MNGACEQSSFSVSCIFTAPLTGTYENIFTVATVNIENLLYLYCTNKGEILEILEIMRRKCLTINIYPVCRTACTISYIFDCE